MKSKTFFNKFLNIIAAVVFLMIISANSTGQISEPLKKQKDSAPGSAPMYMLTYDHGGLVLWGTEHFTKYLRDAVAWLDRYPGFKIGLDNEAYTYDFLSQHDTVLLSELRGYMEHYKGRFGIGTCTYGQPLSQFINEESNIRQIGYAIETDQSVFHYRPSVYLMSEHAMHSQIPQILKGFEFKGAIMRTHFMMYGYNPTYDSPSGWWVGLDGSRMRTVPTYKGEGSGFGWVTEDNLILTRYPGPECNEPLEAFKEKFSGINPLLATRADDSGLRQEELVKQYEGRQGYRWLLLDELFDLFPPNDDEYKTLPDDFHVRMPWGYCGNEIWNMSRQAEVRVLTAERLAALESLLGGKNHEAELRESWKNLLVAQHHDIQICGILKDSRRFLPASIGLSDSVIHSSMSFVSLKMRGGGLAQITVFNPNSWTRNEWITIDVALKGDIKSISVTKEDRIIPFEIISSEFKPDLKKTKLKLIMRTEIPGLTFQSFSIVKSKGKEPVAKTIEFNRQNMQITTPFWVIDLNKNGGLSSVRSRMTGRQMLKNGRNGYFAGVINGKALESSGKWATDSAGLTGNQLILHENGRIGSIPYRLEMKLTGGSPLIEYKVLFHFEEENIGRVTDNKQEIGSAFLHEEKLRFKIFPSLGIGTTGIRDLPFAIAETDDNYVEGNYWTALADGHSGIAFFNRGNMGSVRESDSSFSLPLAYSMYYIWKTVILKGDYIYEFAVYPFEGKYTDSELHKKALEYNFPCITGISAGNERTSGPEEIQPLIISSKDMVLSALYTRDGKPYIRFYESKGLKGELKIDYKPGPYVFTEVNLEGNESGNTESPLFFSPWQIRTLKLVIPDRRSDKAVVK
jgi:alpha-mannosidase